MSVHKKLSKTRAHFETYMLKAELEGAILDSIADKLIDSGWPIPTVNLDAVSSLPTIRWLLYDRVIQIFIDDRGYRQVRVSGPGSYLNSAECIYNDEAVKKAIEYRGSAKFNEYQ